MANFNSWLDSNDLLSISEPLRSKISDTMNELNHNILNLQNDNAVSAIAYENTIEMLKKRLEEKNKNNLELQMEVLKKKTLSEEPVKPKAFHSKQLSILRNKIAILTKSNKESKKREEALKYQLEFLLKNADKDSKELCEIISDQTLELQSLKSKLNKNTSFNNVNMKIDYETMLRNEKEYQTYIYEKSKEIYGLEQKYNNIQVENSLLQKFKTKYDNLYNEFIKLNAILNELKISNIEYKRLLDMNASKNDILKELEMIEIIKVKCLVILRKH